MGIKNLTANTGDRFDPWPQEIPYAEEQLSPWVTTTEPTCCKSWSLHSLEPVLRSKGSHSNEKIMRQNCRVAPCLPQLEKNP